MEIKFPKDKKKQRYLVLIIVMLIIVVFVIIWIGIFRGEGIISPGAQPKKEIRINFSILEDSILEQLYPFEEISPFEGKEGKSNPFVPY